MPGLSTVIPWKAIEADFISGLPYDTIATKYNIAKNRISVKASQQGWTSKRRALQASVVTKVNQQLDASVEKVVSGKAGWIAEETTKFIERTVNEAKRFQDSIQLSMDQIGDPIDPEAIQKYAVAWKNVVETNRKMLNLDSVQAGQQPIVNIQLVSQTKLSDVPFIDIKTTPVS